MWHKTTRPGKEGIDFPPGFSKGYSQWIASRRIVDIILIITGDADLVPAMKLAWKEGLKVYLNTLGHPVN